MPAVPTTEMKAVLKIYLENGTHESPISLKRSVKFLSVGLTAKNLGGNTQSSSRGLSDWDIAYTNGSAMTAPTSARMT